MRASIESCEARTLLASVTGSVFVDGNGDGAYQSGTDKRLAGAVAFVDFNSDGVPQTTEPQAASDANGYFKIDDARILANTPYTFRVATPAGYVQTTLPLAKLIKIATGGTSAYVGLIAAQAGGTTPVGPNDTTPPTSPPTTTGTMKLTAFSDTNKNHVQDSGETAIAKQTYFIDANRNYQYDAGDTLLGSGAVSVTLKPGNYQVLPVVNVPDRLSNPINTTYVNLTVTAGQTTSYNFGIYHPARYSGHVYEDLNANGKFDAGEGVFDRNIVAKSTTGGYTYGDFAASDGSYYIDLDPGTYVISQVLPNGWTGAGSKTVVVKGSTTTVVSGVDFSTKPAATSSTGVITGKLFTDTNGNGKQDSGEGAFNTPSPMVWIDYNHDGYENYADFPADAVHGGQFTFANMKPGSYRVAVESWDQYAHVTTVTYRDVKVSANKTVSAGSFGLQQRFVINVESVNDVDGDGVYDPPMSGNDPNDTWGDQWTSNRTVYIDANNNGKFDSGEQSVTTGYVGGYASFIVPAGTYTIREATPVGYKQTGRDAVFISTSSTFKADSKVRLPADESTTSNGNDITLYFLSAVDTNTPDPKTAQIAGEAFRDYNGNGLWDIGDDYDANQRIYLDKNDNGILDAGEPSALTDTYGRFNITGIAAGTYRLRGQYAAGYATSGTPQYLTFTRGEIDDSFPEIGRKQLNA